MHTRQPFFPCVSSIIEWPPEGEFIPEVFDTVPEIACGDRSYRRTHGWLCFGHYDAQQKGIPAKPRKPRYYHAPPQKDEEIIREIIADDSAAILAGHVETIKASGAVLRLWSE